MPCIVELIWGVGGVQMKIDKNLMAGFEVGHWDVPMPILAIVGTLLGLGYIIVLPFVGLAGFILLGGYRAQRGLAPIWRKTKTR